MKKTGITLHLLLVEGDLVMNPTWMCEYSLVELGLGHQGVG